MLLLQSALLWSLLNLHINSKMKPLKFPVLFIYFHSAYQETIRVFNEIGVILLVSSLYIYPTNHPFFQLYWVVLKLLLFCRWWGSWLAGWLDSIKFKVHTFCFSSSFFFILTLKRTQKLNINCDTMRKFSSLWLLMDNLVVQELLFWTGFDLMSFETLSVIPDYYSPTFVILFL